MTRLETLEMALEALEGLVNLAHEAGFPCDRAESAITALHQQIELEKQQPAAPETMTVQEVWEAAGGNPGFKATKQEVIYTLKLLDEVCDEADKPAAQNELTCVCGAVWQGEEMVCTPHKKPAAQWVGLTDEDRKAAFESLPDMLDGFLNKWGWLHFSKAIEQRLKEKNT